RRCSSRERLRCPGPGHEPSRGHAREERTPAVAEPMYVFEGGYPTRETVQRAYDEADLNRAVSAYRFFYPTVSIMATWQGNRAARRVANEALCLLGETAAP